MTICHDCGRELADSGGRVCCPDCGSELRDHSFSAEPGAFKLRGGNVTFIHEMRQDNRLAALAPLLNSGGTIALVGFPLYEESWVRKELLKLAGRKRVASIEGRSGWHIKDQIHANATGYIQLNFGDDASGVASFGPVEHLSDSDISKYVSALHEIDAVTGVIMDSKRSLKHLAGVREIDVPDSIITYEVRDHSYIQEINRSVVVVGENVIEKLKKWPEDVYKLSPHKFEEMIAALLADQGCKVEMTLKTRDGGKDIIASMDTAIGKVITLVEAKRYNDTRPVRVELLRQLYGVLHDHPASHAMLVTTSYFTRDAEEFQRRHDYELSLRKFADIKNWIEIYKGTS